MNFSALMENVSPKNGHVMGSPTVLMKAMKTKNSVLCAHSDLCAPIEGASTQNWFAMGEINAEITATKGKFVTSVGIIDVVNVCGCVPV